MNYHIENYFYPSIREMMEFMNVHSTCTISYYLDILETKGILSRPNQRSRALIIQKPIEEIAEILDATVSSSFVKNNHISNKVNVSNDSTLLFENSIMVPVIGEITAGQPILAVENYDETYKLPFSLFQRENIFMLNVHGESMIEAGIFDGDRIVVLPQSNADNGDIVVAMLSDSATVKKFYREKDKIRLQPCNSSMEPIYADTVNIIGKVIGLIRNL